jgi:hypothetical protein
VPSVVYHCSKIDTLNTILKVKICVEVIVLESLFGFTLSQVLIISICYLNLCTLHGVTHKYIMGFVINKTRVFFEA